MKIVVLGGAGAMGQVIVRDLCESQPGCEVVIADFNRERAEELRAKLGCPGLSTAFADVRDTGQLAGVLKAATAVVNSTPYYFNLNVMEASLQAGCHYLDLGGLFHVTRRQLELDAKFKERGLTAVLGMGAAPGMTNVMAAHCASSLETIESIDIAIGCVDFVKVEHPMYPPYALDTILDEYTKEPMVFEGGQFKAKPPMSGEVAVNFPDPVGRVNAIYTLHSEVATLPLSYQSKGVANVSFRLGLPSDFHEKLKFLVELGLAETEVLMLEQGPAVPRKVLARLIDRFAAPKGDPDDCEVVRVDVRGRADGREKLTRLETTVYSHKQWKISCGALDTGVPPSIVAQMIARGDIAQRGVLAPETCVPAEPFFDELARRFIIMRRISEEYLSS